MQIAPRQTELLDQAACQHFKKTKHFLITDRQRANECNSIVFHTSENSERPLEELACSRTLFYDIILRLQWIQICLQK